MKMPKLINQKANKFDNPVTEQTNVVWVQQLLMNEKKRHSKNRESSVAIQSLGEFDVS